jgi:uncharacterized cupin superfamily protein
MPIIDRSRATRRERSAYPGSRRARTLGCFKTMLSDQGGLTQFGVGEVELSPGSATSLMHWHEQEDEFVYVLEGEVVLVEEQGGERTLHPGDCAAFPAGKANGHTIENRSQHPARLLEVGTRYGAGERAYYTDLDMIFERTEDGIRFVTHQGRELTASDEPEET